MAWTLYKKRYTNNQQAYKKRCSKSLITSETQIRTTMSHHYIYTPELEVKLNSTVNTMC